MSLGKRIAIVVVSFAFVIAAALFGTSPKSLAGAGNGINERIATLTELEDLLTAIDGNGSRSIAKLAKNIDGYTSFSMVEVTNAYSKTNYSSSGDYSSSSQSSKSSVNRTLEIYVNEDYTYYVSEGRFTSYDLSENHYSANSSIPYKHTSRTSKLSMDFKIRIFIGNERVLLYVEKLNLSYKYEYYDSSDSDNDVTKNEQDKDIDQLKNYSHQWIDCTSYPSIADVFLEIDSANMKTLSSFSRLLRKEIDSDKSIFLKSDNIYTLKSEPLTDFVGVPKDSEDDFDGKLIIDLSNKTNPSINFEAKVKINEKSDTITNNSYVYISDDYKFRNINNTVIREITADTVDIKDIIKNSEEKAA